MGSRSPCVLAPLPRTPGYLTDPEANRRGSVKDLIVNFKHSGGLLECAL